MTKVKRTTFFKALYRKLKIEHHEPNSKPVVNSCTPDDWAVPAPYVAPVVLLLLQTRGVFNDNELNICDGYPNLEYLYTIKRGTNYNKADDPVICISRIICPCLDIVHRN